jgi:cation diffusion facilitator CzcD-associated flavoprotein CzcO
MHSHDFRDAEEFRDKNVVVLGSSYSAKMLLFNVTNMEQRVSP